MRRPIVVAIVIGIVFAGATLALILFSAAGAMAHTCEVCVTFRGQTVCREAVGSTSEEATRTAIDNACAFLARGMTEIVECTTRTTPAGVDCSAH